MFGFSKIAIAAAAALALTVSAAPIQKRHFDGQATYYATGLGACGWESADGDFIVALNQPMYQEYSHCGEKVAIHNPAKGTWEVATVVDECPGCAYGSLDMSPALFSALNDGDMDAGVFHIGWHFIN